MQKIILVGCGNVGSRHLQALAKLQGQVTVDIVEPNKDNQIVAKSRLNEIPYDEAKKIFWHESIHELKDESELAIVATLSTDRTSIIRQLLELGHSRFLIEKMVCQSTDEYEMLLAKMKIFNAKGWVNTPRRYFGSYQKIKEYFQEPGRIHLSVSAGNEGLGANAIHFIDLFSWLCGDYKIKLNGEFLYNRLFTNKRGTNLKEFAGTIVGAARNDSTLSITFLPYDNLPYVVNIIGNDKHLVIDESNERLHVVSGGENIEYPEFRSEYVSSITTEIVNDILESDDCLLPTLRDSSYAHYELFRIFNVHIKKLTNKEVTLCPIT